MTLCRPIPWKNWYRFFVAESFSALLYTSSKVRTEVCIRYGRIGGCRGSWKAFGPWSRHAKAGGTICLQSGTFCIAVLWELSEKVFLWKTQQVILPALAEPYINLWPTPCCLSYPINVTHTAAWLSICLPSNHHAIFGPQRCYWLLTAWQPEGRWIIEQNNIEVWTCKTRGSIVLCWA